MVWLLKKPFSFISPYSMKECRKALTSLESEQSSIKLLELDDKRSEIFCKIGRYYEENGKSPAYSEAQLKLTERQGIIEVSGQATIFIVQILFYTYFIVATLTFAYVFRGFLPLALFMLLFTYFSARWLRLVFINRELMIGEIQETLGR